MPEEPTNSNQDVRLCYEDWHSRYGVDSNADTPWHSLIRHHMSIDRDLAGKRILEIGCGRGGFSCWLAQTAEPPRRITAVDFSMTAVRKGEEYARARGVASIDWAVGDIQAIAHPDCSFDTVISCETIEHVPDPVKALRELGRVLKPQGRLFLSTPNYFNMLGLYRLYLPLRGRTFKEEDQPINNFMLLPRTEKWIRRAGLRVLNATSSGHYLPWPGRPPIRISDRIGRLNCRFGLHSLVVAEKPALPV